MSGEAKGQTLRVVVRGAEDVKPGAYECYVRQTRSGETEINVLIPSSGAKRPELFLADTLTEQADV